MDVDEEQYHDDDSSSDSDDDLENQKLLKNVKEYRNQLNNNRLDYDAHVGLISSLRKLGEFEDLRKAREDMNEIYPLSPDLWMEWLSDEQKLCTQKEEQQYIISLFEKAVHEYTSVKLWVEYIMFMLGCGTVNDTRNVCEKALMAVGIHLAEGILIWQAVILVEQQFFVNQQTQNNDEAIEEQKKRIQNLYQRQARVPLMNIDKDEFLKEASNWFSNNEIDSRIKNDLEKSYKKMEEKVPFEEALLRAEDETAKLEAYRKYIDKVRADDNPAVIQNIYERTVTDLCLNAGLWEEYVKFVMDQFPSADYVVLPVCKRSQLNCSWSGALCELHITCLERFAYAIGDEEAALKIKESLQKTLSSGVTVGAELVKAWMAYLTYLRRKIMWNEVENTQLDNFRTSCEQAIEFMDEHFGEEGDIECEIARFQARIEAESAKNIEGARKLWNDYIMKRNKNSKNPNMWLEFINLERSFGSAHYCRKLFRRALERVWDWVEVIGNAYLQFERAVGSLDTMLEFQSRYRDRLSIVLKKRLEDAAKEEKATQHQKTTKQYKHKKETSSPGTSFQVKEVGDSKFKKPFPVSNKSANKVPIGENKLVSPSKKRALETEQDHSPPKRQKVENVHGEFIKHDHSLDHVTVFLSNMDYNAEDKDILPIFKDCGEIESLRITRDFKGRSKGFGYLVFKSMASVQKALKLDRTPIKTRPLFVSPCNPTEKEKIFKFADTLEKEKLFVRGLPFSMTEQEVKEAFEPHGPIKSIRLVTLRNGHSKGNCYIEYHDASTAENVRQKMDGVLLKDCKLTVLISNPSVTKQNKFQSSRPYFRENPVPGPSRGGGQKPKLSLLPRSLLRNPPKENVINGNNSSSNNVISKPKSNEDFRKMLLK